MVNTVHTREKTNWRRILDDIGLTGKQIHDRTGISQAYLSRLKTGKRGASVDYDIGCILMDLLKQRRLELRTEKEVK